MNSLKTLYLIRHGKSDRSNFDRPDLDRPLTSRGITNCQEVGAILKTEQPSATFLAMSIARRTRQSAENILSEFTIPEEHQMAFNELYLPDLSTLLGFITTLNSDHDAAIIVGHEPSISDLLFTILKKPVEPVVTSSISKIQFACDDWSTARIDNVCSVHHRNRHNWLGQTLL